MEGFSVLTDLRKVESDRIEMLEDIMAFIDFLKKNYNLPISIYTVPKTNSSSNTIYKNKAILSLLKKYGTLTSEQIINLLIENDIFPDSTNSRSNIRSRISRLVKARLIKQDSWGGPYELVKSYSKKVENYVPPD